MSLSVESSRAVNRPFGSTPLIHLGGAITKSITVDQREKLHALAGNPIYAEKLLAAIERSPRIANALWDVCGSAYLTLASM